MIGNRDQLPPDVLVERAYQRVDEFDTVPGDMPGEPCFVEVRDGDERNRRGNAVVNRSGIVHEGQWSGRAR